MRGLLRQRRTKRRERRGRGERRLLCTAIRQSFPAAKIFKSASREPFSHSPFLKGDKAMGGIGGCCSWALMGTSPYPHYPPISLLKNGDGQNVFIRASPRHPRFASSLV